MNELNIITANFNLTNKKQIITRAIFQYDYGQKLKIEGLNLQNPFQAHFSNHENDNENNNIIIGTNNEVDIPNEYLLSGQNIYIFILINNNKYKIKIPVIERPILSEQEPIIIQHNLMTMLNNNNNNNDNIDKTNGLNIVTVNFIYDGRQAATRKIFQYDYGQLLKIRGIELPNVFEIHFSNQKMYGIAKKVLGNNNKVIIPDQYLLSGQDIYAYIVLHQGQNDGETRHVIKIPVVKRPEPIEQHPTPVQQDIIEAAIAVLNKAIIESRQNVSHYPTIIDGYWYLYDAQLENYISTGVDAHGIQGKSAYEIAVELGYTGTEEEWIDSITQKDATNIIKGIMKLYNQIGQNIDGTITQKVITDTFNTKVDKISGKGLSTNDYTTEEKQKLAGIEINANNYSLPAATSNTLGGVKVGNNLTITNGILSAVVPTNNNELINGAGYQTAQEVLDTIANAIGDLEGTRFEVVNNLPAIGETGKIYLIPDANDGENNSYDEYIWIENIQTYEKIGNTDIDLSDYYNTSNLVPITIAEIDEICI